MHYLVKRRCSTLLHNFVGLIIIIRLLTFASPIPQKAPQDWLFCGLNAKPLKYSTMKVYSSWYNFSLHLLFQRRIRFWSNNLWQLKGYTATSFLRNSEPTRKHSCHWQTRTTRNHAKKVLQFDVETSYRKLNNLFEVMQIRCFVIKFLIQITSTYSS